MLLDAQVEPGAEGRDPGGEVIHERRRQRADELRQATGGEQRDDRGGLTTSTRRSPDKRVRITVQTNYNGSVGDTLRGARHDLQAARPRRQPALQARAVLELPHDAHAVTARPSP